MIFLFLACKNPEPPNGEPHPVDFEIPVTELEDIVNESFGYGLPSALKINEVYAEMMSLSDGICPSFSQGGADGQGHWADSCVTDSGTHFLGFGMYSDVKESEQPDGSQMGSLWGSCEVITAEGFSRQIGGISSIRISKDLGLFTQMIESTFEVSDSEPWLEGGSHNYMIDGILDQKTTLTGGIEYPEVVLYFNDLIYHPESCGDGLGIQGEMLIRDSSGYWFSIERTSCTPCSDLFWGEQNLGEFCVWQSLDTAIKSYLSEVEGIMYP